MADLNKYEELEKLAELLAKGVLTQQEFEERKAKILSRESNLPTQKTSQAKKASKEPSKPLSEQFAPLIAWFNQNKKVASIGFASLVLLIVAYKFFIQNNPESDGQKAAKTECNCKTEKNESFIAAYEEFLKGYDGFGIKTREDAQKKLQEVVEKHTKETSNCEENAKSKYNSLKEKYILDYEEKNKFENAYSAQQGICSVEKETEKNQLLADIEKIEKTYKFSDASASIAKEQEQRRQDSIAAVHQRIGNENYQTDNLYSTGTTVNIRSIPNTSSQSNTLAQLGFETEVSSLKSSSLDDRGVVWYKVNYNGIEGWVSSKFISSDKFFKQTWKKATINDPDGYTNVRESTNSNSHVLAKINVGERFTVISMVGDWWLVILKDETRGYIHKSRIILD